MNKLIFLLRLMRNRVLMSVPGKHQEQQKKNFRSRMQRFAPLAFQRALSRLPRDAVAIDLGANVGEVTRELAQHFDRVIAFEPDPWTFEQLTKNCADLTNVELHQAAAGDADGTIQLYRKVGFDDAPEEMSVATSIFASKINIDRSKPVEVPLVDMTRFISELGKVALLKIDIEGAEVPLLEKLLASEACKNIDYIFVETHEFMIPELMERTDALYRVAARMRRPRVNLYWH